MKIGLLRIGKVEEAVLNIVEENVRVAFPKAECTLLDEVLPVPAETVDGARRQYRSDLILAYIRGHAENTKVFNRVLGIIDVDVFVPELNFVFGEAECPGKAALVSLFRLKPEFYGKPSNMALLAERASKEAVHELGHTFGLTHCPNLVCVMYFSNSIFETDRKQSLFCNKCQMILELMSKRG